MNNIEGGVCAPKGFKASGVNAGVKPGSTKKDCALIVSDAPCTVAGMFTQNVMKAPPIAWTQHVVKSGTCRAVVLNSGNANAATGLPGETDAQAMAAQAATGINASPDEVGVCSTGVIGVPLPMDRINAGIDACIAALSTSGSADAAEAIMTTDTVPKEYAVEVELSSGPVRIGAIAKGAGMISPNMATMFGIFTTDANIPADLMDGLLRPAVQHSFNQICIDNDMSTSDVVLLLANGASGTEPLQLDTDDYDLFADALQECCTHMAHWLVKDGEGVTKFVEIEVTGAASDNDARTIARAIGNSQLCKTAFFGEDPNWGRFACAAGYAGVSFDPADLNIHLGDIQICAAGLVGDFTEEDAAAVMKQPEFVIRVSVGQGSGSATFWTSDLSHDYITINADYRT